MLSHRLFNDTIQPTIAPASVTVLPASVFAIKQSGIEVETQGGSRVRLSSSKAPILSAGQMDALAQSGAVTVPFPEMCFGSNSLRVAVRGLVIGVDAVRALASVQTSSEAMDSIKVAFAKEWTEKSEKLHGKIKQIERPYDWTYTPKNYCGTLGFEDGQSGESDPRSFVETTERIDVDMLKRNEPILWYDEVVLYEDELADNGACMLTARVRVMPSCFLILLRFFLRVDNVLFRIHDTRIFHAFDSPHILREYSTRECNYARVLARVPAAGGLMHAAWSGAGGGGASGLRGARSGGGGTTGTSGMDLSLLNKPDWVAAGMVDPIGVNVYLGPRGSEESEVIVDGVKVCVWRDQLIL
ncbi:TIP41-like family-domain-containing protein [Chytriomyces sp. MP71]|nr:TIP41-like family-domain-containing protein [Chytriomyces sp. MP71]